MIPGDAVDGGVAARPEPRQGSIQSSARALASSARSAPWRPGGHMLVGAEEERDDGGASARPDGDLGSRSLSCSAASRMYGDGDGGAVWDRVARPHRDCTCYLGPPATLTPM